MALEVGYAEKRLLYGLREVVLSASVLAELGRPLPRTFTLALTWVRERLHPAAETLLAGGR